MAALRNEMDDMKGKIEPLLALQQQLLVFPHSYVAGSRREESPEIKVVIEWLTLVSLHIHFLPCPA